ncbi:hypothetical protein K2173_019334 [Erythroxylum novogranatense]|uniref:PGG domain-containing protein n=1 Tax=Erythroxylum novogranatense TaxID=1862640 RepID=A0AAV8SU49_9ROSI|nr:hypothetical protein K2173_019334 [Erythroxylum novogranatense]
MMNTTFDMEVDDLFEMVMKGRWNEFVDAYDEKRPGVHENKITRSGDTALHIAASDGQTKVVLELIKILREKAPKVLRIQNSKGNTPLHLAAALGNVSMCHHMAERDPTLLADRNLEGETPLFLTAVGGKKKAFLCLHDHHQKNLSQTDQYAVCRKTGNGDTILHAAISGEHFSLAFQIILKYPDLVNSFNVSGWSPLHVLANNPTTFRSGCPLGLLHRFFYFCIPVEELKEEIIDHKALLHKSEVNETVPWYPATYQTCINVFQVMKTSFKVLTGVSKIGCQMNCFFPRVRKKNRNGNPNDGENQKSENSFTNQKRSGAEKEKLNEGKSHPPNQETIVQIGKIAIKTILVVLGIGIQTVLTVKAKKQKHVWATQIMNELVCKTSYYKYSATGKDPQYSMPGQAGNTIEVPEAPSAPDDHETFQTMDPHVELNHGTPNEEKHQTGRNIHREQDEFCKLGNRHEADDVRTMLVAFRNGVTEMVDKFHETYPNSVQVSTSTSPKYPSLFEKKDNQGQGEQESAILIAAKMGVTEIVDRILDAFPVAVQDMDRHGKNVVLLAVENRQIDVYKLLINRKTILKEPMFRQVDNKGNSALHLAARHGKYRPWLIPGAALHMQWESKWYQFVKDSMPKHFFAYYNDKYETAEEVFTDTHKELVANGREWLTKTSESCSVVAALITTVSFATVATVPGGLNQSDGIPILEDKSGFGIFAISSFVALCLSLTALVFFLAILTSRYQEIDFFKNLPRKLLLGLTSLFASIVCMMISFCAGHFFILKKDLRQIAYPIYGATCLPVTLFAVAERTLYFDLILAILKQVPERSYRK